MFARVVLAVPHDGLSDDAVEDVLRLCEEQRAKLSVVHVLDYGTAVAEGINFTAVQRHWRAEAETRLSAIARAAEAHGVRVGVRIVDGQGRWPAAVLIELAAEQRADVLILGPRRRGRLLQLLGGSTTRDVLDRSPVPVLVLPRVHRAATANAG